MVRKRTETPARSRARRAGISALRAAILIWDNSPSPGNFERFYKAGEHGAPLDIKNARYVLFRIPPAAQSGGSRGKSVVDNERTSADGAVSRTCRSRMNASRPSPTNVNSFRRATVTC